MEKKFVIFIVLGLLLISFSLAAGVKLLNPTNSLGFNNTDLIHRGDTFKIYANWTEHVNSSVISLNITGSSLRNFTDYTSGSTSITNETWNSTWTNYSIKTNGTWALGKHLAKIYVNSTWENGTSVSNETNGTFEIWGWYGMNDTETSLNSQEIGEDDLVNFTTRLVDMNTSEGVSGQNVSLYINNIGPNVTSTTDSNGYVSFVTSLSDPGTYILTVNTTDNATKYYNFTSGNTTTLSVIPVDKWSSPNGEFGIMPNSISLNWTNNERDNITVKMNSSLDYQIDLKAYNDSSSISSNYSQIDVYRNSPYSDKYNSSGGSGCFVFEGGEENHLVVKNSTGDYDNVKRSQSASDKFNFTLINSHICPPGKYYGQFPIQNNSGIGEVNITTLIDIPIRTENQLSSTYGNGTFGGILPAYPETYHSYYFNTSEIENATSVKVMLGNFPEDIDLFLFDGSNNLVSKSIEKGNESEELHVRNLPDNKTWEIRIYGNVSSDSSYISSLHFSTLNITNSSNDELINNIDFGDRNPGYNKVVDIKLKNEGNLNHTNVEQSSDVYHVEEYTNSSTRNFTFLVPEFATKIQSSVSWNGSSDYTLNLYYPNGTLYNNSSSKRLNANITGTEQEEYVTLDLPNTLGLDKDGYWTVGVKNESTANDDYGVEARFWVNSSEWLSSNYNKTDLNALVFGNSTDEHSINLTVPSNVISGMYGGEMEYRGNSGASVSLPFEINVTTSTLLGDDNLKSTVLSLEDNIGFNRSFSNPVQGTVTLQNVGNEDLTFDNNSSSLYLNHSSRYMEFVFDHNSSINTGDSVDLDVNVSIDTNKTANDDGIYWGWIYLNDTDTNPYQGFNVTVKFNLTNSLNVHFECGNCGIESKDGDDDIENVSLDQNISVKSLVSYINGTYINKSSSGILTIDNFSIWLVEENVPNGYRYPLSSGSYLSKFNDSFGSDVWNNGDKVYDPNVSIPVNSQNIPGGYYSVYQKVDHYVNGQYLTGNDSYNYLEVNNSGLYMDIVDYPGPTIGNGTTDIVNVSITNYGPLESENDQITLNKGGKIDTVENIQNGCGSDSQGAEIDFGTINTNQTCYVAWEITAGDDDGDTTSTINGTSGLWFNSESFTTNINAPTEETTTTTASDNGGGTATTTTTVQEEHNRDISLSLDPKNLSVQQGNVSSMKVNVENTGDILLDDLILNVSEIPKSWIDVTLMEMNGLEVDEIENFTVDIQPSLKSPIKEYNVKFIVSNDNVSESIEGKVKVTPSPNKCEELNASYHVNLEKYENFTEEMKSLKESGKDVSKLNETIVNLKSKLDEVKESIGEKDYFAVNQKMSEVKSLVEETEEEAERIKSAPKGGIPLWAILFSVVIAIIVGSCFVYMFLPSEEGYKSGRGYIYKPPKKESFFSTLSESIKEGFGEFKKKLGMEHKHDYNYTRRDKWKKKEEEE